MKFPNKRDYIDNIDGYVEEVITTCLEAHKSLINDTLVTMTDGKITHEQQAQYFIGKQLFSDEPIYKLLRLTANYKNDAYKDQKEEILFSITHEIDQAQKFIGSITKKNHDSELRLMAEMMHQSGRSVSAIAQELCDIGWYDYENVDSLERIIHRWIKNYNFDT